MRSEGNEKHVVPGREYVCVCACAHMCAYVHWHVCVWLWWEWRGHRQSHKTNPIPVLEKILLGEQTLFSFYL